MALILMRFDGQPSEDGFLLYKLRRASILSSLILSLLNNRIVFEFLVIFSKIFYVSTIFPLVSTFYHL